MDNIWVLQIGTVTTQFITEKSEVFGTSRGRFSTISQETILEEASDTSPIIYDKRYSQVDTESKSIVNDHKRLP